MNLKHNLFKPYWIIILLLLFCIACGASPIEPEPITSTQPITQTTSNQPSSTEPSASFVMDNKMETTQVMKKDATSPASTLDLSNLSEEEQAIAIASAYEPVASTLSNYPKYKAFAYSEDDGYWEVEFFASSEEETEENETEENQFTNENDENEESEENEENNEDYEGNEEDNQGNEEGEESDEEGEEGEWLGYVLLNLSTQEIIEYEIVQHLSEEELAAVQHRVQTALLQHPEIIALIGDAAGWNIELEYDPYEQLWLMFFEKEATAWLAEAVIEEEQVILINISDPTALDEEEKLAFQQEQAIELAYEGSNAPTILNGIDDWTTYVATQEDGRYGVSFVRGEEELYFALVDVDAWQVVETVP